MKKILLTIICCLMACTYSFANKAKLMSTDLHFFELRGPVKSMTVSSTVFLFDTDGKLLSIDGKKPFVNEHRTIEDEEDFYYMRDDKGNIVDVEGWEYSQQFTWKDNVIEYRYEQSEGDNSATTYTYDVKGNIIKLVTKMWEEGEDGSAQFYVQEYEYTKWDDHGNWIECKVNDEPRTRVITYYEK